MQDILFVRDLVIERVPAGFGDTIRYQYMTSPMHQIGSASRAEISSRVVPVVELTGGVYGGERVLLAYSEKVEQALGVPISVIYENQKETQSAYMDCLSKLAMLREAVNKAGLWRRVKYMLTGNLGI